MIRVGTAGWSYPDWEGRVTPRRKPRGFHALSHLAKYLDCVELNSSFYAPPAPQNAARWVALVADHPGFRFSAKLFQGFTHGTSLEGAERRSRIDTFLAAVEPLARAGRLLALLAQFPFSFSHTRANRARLERIAEEFGAHALVVELRHASWYEPAGLDLVERSGLSLAEIDLPAAAAHPPSTAPKIGPVGYLRLHGRNSRSWFDQNAGRDARYDYLYSCEEIEELSKRARRLASGRDETVVITNNHFSGKAVANALELLSQLRGSAPLAPPELVAAFPHLRAMVRVDGQANLF